MQGKVPNMEYTVYSTFKVLVLRSLWLLAVARILWILSQDIHFYTL